MTKSYLKGYPQTPGEAMADIWNSMLLTEHPFVKKFRHQNVTMLLPNEICRSRPRFGTRQGQDEGGIGSSEKHHSVFKSNYSIQSSCNEIPVTAAYPGHTRKGNQLNSRCNDHIFRAFDLLSINKVIVTGWVHAPPI
jgi:hypothetical protein